MDSEIITSLAGGLLGGLLAGIITVWAERKKYRIERAKLLATAHAATDMQAFRIRAYTDLWRCLEGISTYRPDEIVSNLRSVQDKMAHWYYPQGGGLILSGSFEQEGSTKAAFFASRDLKTDDARTIWESFHSLRRCLRRDLGIFEDAAEERRAVEMTKAKLKAFET